VIPVIFLISFLVSFLLPITSRFLLLLIPAILLWGMGGLERKADADEKIELKREQEAEKNEESINLDAEL
jgi:Na+-transporting methylmalonyl-CoA/oxaloacetate decarboxylase gamma subunit